MLEKIKNWSLVLVVAAALVLVVVTVKSCKPDNTPVNTIVLPALQVTPSSDDKKNVPAGHDIVTVIKPRVTPVSAPWEKKDTKIIVHKDSKCNTCTAEYTEVITTKQYRGFSFKPKFFLGYANASLIPGYDQEVFRIGKTTVDLLASMPYAGVGLNYNLTPGFFAGVAGQIQYLKYKDMADPSTYSFDIDSWKTVYPGIQIGFHF